MHCILFLLLLALAGLNMRIPHCVPRKRECGAIYEVQCITIQCTVVAVVVTGRHSRHKLLSFRLISVVCCHVFWCAAIGTGTGTGTFVHPFAQCQRWTWSDFTNFTLKSMHTLNANASTAASRKIYVLFSAMKCLNFFPSFKFLFRLPE